MKLKIEEWRGPDGDYYACTWCGMGYVQVTLDGAVVARFYGDVRCEDEAARRDQAEKLARAFVTWVEASAAVFELL